MTDEPKTLQARLLHKLGSQGEGEGLAFSPDAKTLAVGRGNDVVLYSVADGKEEGKLKGFFEFEKKGGYTTCIDYSPDGKTLASGHYYSTFLWDIKGELTSPFRELTRSSGLAYSPNGLFLVTVEWKTGKLCLWNTQTYEPINECGGEIKKAHPIRILWNVNSKIFLVYGEGRVQVWGIENDTLKSLSIQEGESAAWSPNGAVLAIAKKQVELHQMRDGKLTKTLSLSLPQSCQEIVWLSDTVFLCGGKKENTEVMAWFLRNGKLIDNLRGVFTIINPSKDQLLLATTSNEGVSIRQLFVGPAPLEPFVDEPLPETEETSSSRDGGSIRQTEPFVHDKPISQPEEKIYEALKRREVLCLSNPKVALGGTDMHRYPDFLVCQDGKWGILEVMSDKHHKNPAKDHDRARLFKDYGIYLIEFYDAKRCSNVPDEVVDDFLKRLAKA